MNKNRMKKICAATLMSVSGIFFCAHGALAENAAQPENGKNSGKTATCTQLLNAGIYNEILESVCDFDGGVSGKIKRVYDAEGCRTVLPQSTVDGASKDILVDTKERFAKMGKDAFCKGNADTYNALK